MAGTLVISLDFELHWGVRDLHDTSSSYVFRILNERKVVPDILALFETYDIAATWATVGMMFARDKEELISFFPNLRPNYTSLKLNPYCEELGLGEWDDPLHYAHELIQLIKKYDRQEIATHTFSHYYCLEEGQTKETFAADLRSALNLAKKYGIEIKSIVFPRNQHNLCYDEILLESGIECYRGTENHSCYRVDKGHRLPLKRAYRLLDSYVNLSGSHLLPWEEVIVDNGLCNVRSSRFMRPHRQQSVLTRLGVDRIVASMEEAAKAGQIFHLWAHPQDFGLSPVNNLRTLEYVLQQFKRLQKQYDFASLNMLEVARAARNRRMARAKKDD